MKFKVGDEVRFESVTQTGIGVIVDIDVLNDLPYLIHSEDIERGHNGALFDDEFGQDNNDNWWFKESSLKLVESCDDTDECKGCQSDCNENDDISHNEMLDLFGFEIYEDEDDDIEDSIAKKWATIEDIMNEIDELQEYDDTDEVDMVNEPLHYNLGTIQTLDYIDDVLLHNPNLTALDGYYLGNIIKYLSTRLGTKADKIQDMQKAQFYLNRRVKIEEESE